MDQREFNDCNKAYRTLCHLDPLSFGLLLTRRPLMIIQCVLSILQGKKRRRSCYTNKQLTQESEGKKAEKQQKQKITNLLLFSLFP